MDVVNSYISRDDLLFFSGKVFNLFALKFDFFFAV